MLRNTGRTISGEGMQGTSSRVAPASLGPLQSLHALRVAQFQAAQDEHGQGALHAAEEPEGRGEA